MKPHFNSMKARRRMMVSRMIVSLTLMLMLQVGCSGFRLPAIDPTGKSIFLPCSQSAPPVAAANPVIPPVIVVPEAIPQDVPNNPVFQPQPLTVAPGPPPVQATGGPAFTHPPKPPPCNEPAQTHHSKVHLVPNPKGRKTAGQKGQLIMTPSRIVAPVGSEVVVLAGICGEDGYFVKNQPLEWMLSNNSVGEFIEVGGMNHSLFNRLVPPTSKKLNGQYAKGRTGLKHIVLTRGTPIKVDDIELKKGQTFISVSSASPGTSYVTGYAPKAEGWDRRRTSTTIHWVDGHWSVPVPARATAGTLHAMTTIVNRTDGSGLKGWDVRYSIVGGAPAEFAPAGSQKADAVTNADGQATVQIRQPAGRTSPGTTRVRVDVVRPPIFGEPELVVESGITSVTWSAPALTIRAIANRQSKINEPFNYRVEITNPGDQIARGVVVRTKSIDQGIEFISSTPKPTQYGRQFEWQLGDIAPGSTAKIIDIQMKSKKLGNVGTCFEVASESDGLLTEACSEIEIVPPCFSFKIEGPTNARVGESVTFQMNVENLCNEPLKNLQLQVDYDMGLVRPGESSPATFKNPMMYFGQKDVITITFVAQAAGTQCFNVRVVADGVPAQQERRCLRVGPANGAPIGLDGNTTSGNSALDLTVSGSNTIEVGGSTIIEARITNRGLTPIGQLTLTNRFSRSLEPTEMNPPFSDSVNMVEDEMLVSIGTLAAGQSIVVEIRYKGIQVDPNANTELTISSPTETGDTESYAMRVIPAAGGPDFGARQPPIGIPTDGEPQPRQEELTVQVKTANPNIRVGESARFEFAVTNHRPSPIKNVDVTMLIPNTMALVDFYSAEGTRPLPGGKINRILELPSGETISWIAVFRCDVPGQATFEVQAVSTDTFGVSTGRDVIQINQ